MENPLFPKKLKSKDPLPKSHNVLEDLLLKGPFPCEATMLIGESVALPPFPSFPPSPPYKEHLLLKRPPSPPPPPAPPCFSVQTRERRVCSILRRPAESFHVWPLQKLPRALLKVEPGGAEPNPLKISHGYNQHIFKQTSYT